MGRKLSIKLFLSRRRRGGITKYQIHDNFGGEEEYHQNDTGIIFKDRLLFKNRLKQFWWGRRNRKSHKNLNNYLSQDFPQMCNIIFLNLPLHDVHNIFYQG